MVDPSTHTLLPLALLAVLSACGGADDDDDSGTEPAKATCASVCAQQDKLCGMMSDCASSCDTKDQTAKTTGCEAQYQALLDCGAKQTGCGISQTACPVTDYENCFFKYCASNPMDAVCK